MSYFLGSRNELLENYLDHISNQHGATELSIVTPSRSSTAGWAPAVEVTTKRQTKPVWKPLQHLTERDDKLRELVFALLRSAGHDATMYEDKRQIAVHLSEEVTDELVELVNLRLWTELRSLLIRHSPGLSRR